ncbi:MAG: glycosyltransferase family 4 protein [Minisyncoccia bacterium]
MKLLIFTQKVDTDDVVLGFFHEWILEFSKKCQSIKVICLYKSEFDLPENVEVFSLGKEDGTSKIGQGINLFKYLFRLNGSYDKVFVHMDPIYLVLCGWYLWIKDVPVYMWYVHRSVDLKLRIATFFSRKIFTSSPESFGIKTPKVVYMGHGINTDELIYIERDFSKKPLSLVHLGRVTPIKNLDTLILTGANLKEKGVNVSVSFHGDCVTETDKDYKASLESLADTKGLKNEIIWAGKYRHDNLAEVLKNAQISLNLAPTGGMDKAVLESILMGIPVFVSNNAFNDLFGDNKNLFVFNNKDHLDLSQKIVRFLELENKKEIMKNLDKKVRENFSLTRLIDRMIETM